MATSHGRWSPILNCPRSTPSRTMSSSQSRCILSESVQGALYGRGDRPEHRTERATGTHTLALAVNDAEHVEIALRAARLGSCAVNILQLRPHPVRCAFEHGEGDGIVRVEIVVEARFADADFVGNVLEAEAVEAPRLNQALRRV